MKFKDKLHRLGSVDLDARAHCGSCNAASDVLTFSSSRFCSVDGADKSVVVVNKLFCAEGNLADRAVDDVGSVKTILNLTSLSVLNSLSNVRCNSAGLRGRHETLRTKYSTETANDTHHVRGSDNNVEIEEVFFLDTLNHIHTAYIVSASLFSLVIALFFAEYQNANVFTCTVDVYKRQELWKGFLPALPFLWF